MIAYPTARVLFYFNVTDIQPLFNYYHFMKFQAIFFMILLNLTLFSPKAIYAQRLKTGPQDLSFFSGVDETDQPYAIYIPKNYDESKKYPLVVFLHGAASNHRLGLQRVFGGGNDQGYYFNRTDLPWVESDLEATRTYDDFVDVDCIVACSFARGTAGYKGIPEQDIFDMIEDIKSRLNVDEDRFYLAGLSMGGYGTQWISLTRPDMWAAVVPCCPLPLEDIEDYAMNACNLPFHLFIGDQDIPITYNGTMDLKQRLEKTARLVNFVEYPGMQHNVWNLAFKDGFIFDWFSQFKRDLYPMQVKYNTKYYKYTKAYWVTIDKLTPGTLASIDASFTAGNSIEIITLDLEAFTLNLNGHSQFNTGKRLQVIIDGQLLKLKTDDAASFMKVNGAWRKGKYSPGSHSKKAGAEGPLSAAVASNHVYVYGTRDNPDPEELEARRAQASYAANWSQEGDLTSRIMIFPRVIADTEIRQSDYEVSNLILFGTSKTNHVINEFADRLPIHLKNGTGEYGLVYIFPMNTHYVLINSGLPWWTEPEVPVPQGITFGPSTVSTLDRYKDFILFNGTPDHVVSEGYFDENWEVPAAELSKMKVSGVIETRE